MDAPATTNLSSSLTAYRPSKQAIIALVLAAAGFVVYLGESGETVRNGRVTDSYNYNFAAVALGLIAVVMVARDAYTQSRNPERAGPLAAHLVVLGAIAVLGAYQVLRGLDVI